MPRPSRTSKVEASIPGKTASPDAGMARTLGSGIKSRWRWFWGLRGGPATEAAKLGKIGEDAATQFLRAKGLTIVARNWMHKRDEIDIVARDTEALVFVEVRARAAHAPVSGYHSVTLRKKHALARAIRAYLRGLDRQPAHFRFDIVEVKVSDGVAGEVLHFANIPL